MTFLLVLVPFNFLPDFRCCGARRRSSLSTLSRTCRIVSGLASSAAKQGQHAFAVWRNVEDRERPMSAHAASPTRIGASLLRTNHP